MAKNDSHISKYQSWIESAIQKQKYGGEPKSLYEPIHYIMSLGGKRVRPMLILMAYHLFKKNPKKIVDYAIAIELFHCFTLVHDDILDKATMRRGKLSVHEKWNANTALLAGDVMLIKVFEYFSDLKSKKLNQVIAMLTSCASNICEGQQLDMEFENIMNISEKQYLTMIEKKTASLLGFCLQLGATLAGASKKYCLLLQRVGIYLGIGFQLKDDLLDVYADYNKLGKHIGNDIVSNKKTFLLIQAMKLAKGKDKIELNKWLNSTKFDKQKKIVAVMAIYDRLGLGKMTQKKATSFFSKAINELKLFPPQLNTAPLISFAQEFADRER